MDFKKDFNCSIIKKKYKVITNFPLDIMITLHQL